MARQTAGTTGGSPDIERLGEDGLLVRVGKATAIVDVHVFDSDDVMVARGKCYFQLPSTWRDRGDSAATK